MDNRNERLEIAWAMYYSALISMERHPGKRAHGEQPLSLQQLANLADAALLEHQDRWEK